MSENVYRAMMNSGLFIWESSGTFHLQKSPTTNDKQSFIGTEEKATILCFDSFDKAFTYATNYLETKQQWTATISLTQKHHPLTYAQIEFEASSDVEAQAIAEQKATEKFGERKVGWKEARIRPV